MATFQIRFGIPSMEVLYDNLIQKANSDSLDAEELELFEQITKTATFLSHNPKHPSLHTHEIDSLTKRFTKEFGHTSPVKVFQSYMENNTPGARRIFWVYGPGKQEITIVGLEQHPNKNSSAYKSIPLAQLPPVQVPAATKEPHREVKKNRHGKKH
jgi:hypothetical protein